MHIKELIDDINNKIKNYSEIINSLNNEINDLKNSLNSLKEDIKVVKLSQTELLNNLRVDLRGIYEVKEGMKKELYEFNLLKSQLQNKILEKFENALEKELKINIDKLKAEHKDYEDAKKEITLVVKKTSELAEYLNKFIDIGKNIKKEDFELSRYAHEIWKADREKLELMKKIDTLERLIGQMRRVGSGGRR